MASDKSPWVKTSERTPELNIEVLVVDDIGMGLAWTWKFHGRICWTRAGRKGSCLEPKYWMPIPPVPKEEKHDDTRN